MGKSLVALVQMYASSFLRYVFLDDAVATAVLSWRLVGFKLTFQDADEVSRSYGSVASSESWKTKTTLTGSLNRTWLRFARSALSLEANHYASVVNMWRPLSFRDMGKQWVPLVFPALMWFNAFLQHKNAALQITCGVNAYKNVRKKLRIVGDACV